MRHTFLKNRPWPAKRQLRHHSSMPFERSHPTSSTNAHTCSKVTSYLPYLPTPCPYPSSGSHLVTVERPLCAPNSFASPRAHIHQPLFALGVLGAVDRLTTHRTEERSSTTSLLGTPPLRVVIPATALLISAAGRQ